VIIVALFVVQRHGTAAVGRFFGPVMIAWFVAIGASGVNGIVAQPEILKTMSPRAQSAVTGVCRFAVRPRRTCQWRRSFESSSGVAMQRQGLRPRSQETARVRHIRWRGRSTEAEAEQPPGQEDTEMAMSVSEQVGRRAGTRFAAQCDMTTMLADLSYTMAAGACPTRSLAVRAAALATDAALYPQLLQCADGHYMRAARLWLQIASYIENDDEELLAALHLAADCANVGGNAIFTGNCRRRIAAAERQRGIGASALNAAAS
jgi:hypothetical protein